MIIPKPSLELKITNYISEKKTEIRSLIDTKHRVLLESNPGSGKTHLFEEIAQDIITGKRKGRLVFVAPFLIITGQFANKINVDLQLQSGSRKALLPTDKIITSTFQSLHHIASKLNDEDIIIIDEAHALFYSFLKPNNDRQFYISTIQDLYHTKAKVVLMSGTPNLSLLKTLRLYHIKVTKKIEIKAKININFSKSKNIDSAKYFALNAIGQYGEKSLNVIYIKSIKECNNICEMLLNLGYNAKVLTSFEKEEATYMSIADIELVPKDVQFIVTTNVISTGANIKNKNIGSALILNEFNANEIKQFSKRFRSKPEIEIEVVNKPFSTKGSSLNLTKIAKQRNFVYDSLEFHNKSLKNLDYNFDFEATFNKDSQELINPVESINRILDFNLRQESLFIEKAVDAIDSAYDLEDILNSYDDIEAEVISDYTEIETIENKSNITNWDVKTKAIIDDFDQNTDDYIFVMCSNNIQDWGSRNKIKALTKEEYNHCASISDEIIDNVKSVIFLKEILPMFLKYRANFKSTKDFLSYLKGTKSKNQNILPATLLLNELFLKYFKLYENNKSLGNKYSIKLIDEKNYNNLSYEVKALLTLIQKTFDYCLFSKNIQIKNLRMYLEDEKEVIESITRIENFNKIDSGLLNIKNKSFEFSTDNLVKSLVSSLFYVETKRVGKGKIVSSVFKTSLPFSNSGKKLNLSNQTIFTEIGGKEVKITFGTLTPVEEKNKFLSNYDLIMKKPAGGD